MKPDLNFFKDPAFAGFHKALDSEMKRLTGLGAGVKKKQAEPISIEEESILWEKKLLGDHSPQVLLDTMIFLCGIHFALRSGAEHRDLQISQFELLQQTNQPDSLIYMENVSKNHSGGLAHRKVQQKRVIHHSNTVNPSRCLVQLYQTYIKRCPQDRNTEAFYLTPLKKPKSDIWFSNAPVGHNTLAQTVKRLCKAAGISGFKTNHSLRVTSATRLFNCALIMGRTGHQSSEGLKPYKRICEEQKQQVSVVLNDATNGAVKRIKSSPVPATLTVESSSDQEQSQPGHVPSSTVSCEFPTAGPACVASSFSSVAAVAPTLHITGCTNVNITYTSSKSNLFTTCTYCI